MSLKSVWKRGLTFMERRQIEADRAMERLREREERALFLAIENEEKWLAELEVERRAYSDGVERRIMNGWCPTSIEWDEIKHRLEEFGARRRAITDPYGIAALAEATNKPKKPASVFDRYAAHRFRFR